MGRTGNTECHPDLGDVFSEILALIFYRLDGRKGERTGQEILRREDKASEKSGRDSGNIIKPDDKM